MAMETNDKPKRGLKRKEAAFVRLVLQGVPNQEAYKQAFGGTDNPASVRSLVSRVLRRPNVAAAIHEGFERQHKDAIETGIWTRRASIVARLKVQEAIQTEIERRKEGLQKELDGIEADTTLTDADKEQRKGRAMQRPLISRDLITAQLTVCDSLDAMTWTDDTKKENWYEIDTLAHNSPEREAERKAEWESDPTNKTISKLKSIFLNF